MKRRNFIASLAALFVAPKVLKQTPTVALDIENLDGWVYASTQPFTATQALKQIEQAKRRYWYKCLNHAENYKASPEEFRKALGK